MQSIKDIAALEALYGQPAEAALIKVADRLTPMYRRWIMASRFAVLSTVGPEGTDASPRGDVGPVVTEMDPRTLLMPDWRGNNRMDSLRNIVRDGRVSLMFMVPGSTTVVRVNGTAVLTADADMLARFARDGVEPHTVIMVTIAEVYTQCAKALRRSELWSAGDQSAALPSSGDILAEMKTGFDGVAHDADRPMRDAETLW